MEKMKRGDNVRTPLGIGRYWSYDGRHGTIAVEHDFTYLVDYPEDQVTPVKERSQ